MAIFQDIHGKIHLVTQYFQSWRKGKSIQLKALKVLYPFFL